MGFEWRRQFFYFGQNIGERFLFSFRERVGGVAIRAAEVAGGEADENARQPGEGAFPLQAQIDFVDDERFGHEEKLRANSGIKQDFSRKGWNLSAAGLSCGHSDDAK